MMAAYLHSIIVKIVACDVNSADETACDCIRHFSQERGRK